MSKKEYVVARLNVKGKRFEILVDPDKAHMFKEGKKTSIREIIVSDFVYKDARKGLKASPEELEQVFGTTDIEKIAEKILKEGELQLTAEQRKQLLEAKKKQVIYYISKSAIDPKTKAPIPPTLIEKAMDEAKVAVDLYKSVEEQVPSIVKAISRVLPIRLARALLGISVPPEYSHKVASQIMRLGETKRIMWANDGSLILELEIPAGIQNEVIDQI
ncbi:MAG: ribosome assembly factor SBDS, partial [Ignisphaera sp.]